MAASYSDVLQRALQRAEPPGVDRVRVSSQLWESTRLFRYDAIDMAREFERCRPEGYGVRRSDIIRSVAELTGIMTRSDERIPTEAEILASLANPSTREAASRFFTWLDELYFANQANRFGIRASSSARNLEDLSIVQEAVINRLVTGGTSASDQTMEMEVRYPAFEVLRRLSPSMLLDLRELGIEWHARANVFMQSPSTSNRLAAEWALERFADQLNIHVHDRKFETLSVKVVAKSVGWAAFATAVTFVAASLQAGPLGALVSLAREGFLILTHTQHRATQTAHVMRDPTRSPYLVSLGQSVVGAHRPSPS